MPFTKLTRYLDLLPEVYGIPICELSVCKGYEKVYRHSVGNLPYGEKTLYRMFSMTKLVTVTGIMRLVEQGKIDLDDPVYKYLPSYKNLMVKNGGIVVRAQNTMTIRHLLSMRSGLSYNKTTPSVAKAIETPHITTREFADALAGDPLLFEPGTNWFYSFSHDVLAAVAEVVSDLPYDEYLKKEIFSPLGMEDITFFPTDEQKMRIAPIYEFVNDDYSVKAYEPEAPISDVYIGGGSGLYTSNDEYMKLPQALANGGLAENGYRVLRPETIELIKTNHMQPTEQKDFSRAKSGYGYGLGVRTLVDPADAVGQAPVGEFGWDGMAASYSLVDTENNISIVWTTHVVYCRPAYREIHPHIRNLVYDALGIKG